MSVEGEKWLLETDRRREETEVTAKVAEEAEGLLDVFCVGGFWRKADAI